MTSAINLVCFGLRVPDWPLGETWTADLTPASISAVVERHLPNCEAGAWLFWDGALGLPDLRMVRDALQRPGDLWHAGLRLGMRGLPQLLDSVAPNWMLICDPNPEIEATSWRLSFRACLVRASVLRQMGGIRGDFLTTEGAALEFGHRCITRGVFTRHVPWLLPDAVMKSVQPLPLEDETRFLLYRCGGVWTHWALMRAVLSGQISLGEARRAWRAVTGQAPPSQPLHYKHEATEFDPDLSDARVTVLIPTVDRYPYLRTLLGQLRQQTVPPCEIIVIDQTAREYREPNLLEDFNDLPLTVLHQDEPGQCASRNAGLRMAKGDYILFIDDDDEVAPDLIELHLRNLERFRTDVSSGVNEEAGAGPLPEGFSFIRASDVFPTNNTMVHRTVLERSGLFDLAYNRGQRADGDLGLRVYLSGSLMVLDPRISVFHHHAPAGGLRMHKARVITYASSRNRLTHRQLLSATEIYLAGRYFSPRQLRELMWQSVLGTFSLRGGRGRRFLKALIGFACLPHSVWTLRRRQREAMEMLRHFPQIPALAPARRDREPPPPH